jgi:hypothetical protein
MSTKALKNFFGEKPGYDSVLSWLRVVLGLFSRIEKDTLIEVVFSDSDGRSKTATAKPVWWRYPLDKDGGAVTCEVTLEGKVVGSITLLREDEVEQVTPYFTISFGKNVNAIDSMLFYRALVEKVYQSYKGQHPN